MEWPSAVYAGGFYFVGVLFKTLSLCSINGQIANSPVLKIASSRFKNVLNRSFFSGKPGFFGEKSWFFSKLMRASF